ncbi:hypothetical protein C4K68_26250 [Pokkaliibacter plantistimulans]|uniref:Glycosyltransferase family 9 protein n=1 Tax=Proteobacteria bacterium 228 TaxID=2083153 RepID=A0A2S5KIV2_9PROT|nr:glycosyltransferase family 9 protein [Pokkaliibacter plantistimulans]PPC74439.1 hypothetical protein C4K68_26250 [Pokkaliibacter plantistimulans]
MNYLILGWLCWPLLRLLRLVMPVQRGKRLIIQTAKIGDWINTTPLIRALAPVDVVADPMNLPLIRHDQFIQHCESLPARTSLRQKLHLAWRLFRQGYEDIYVLMPSAPNTFLARLACAHRTHTLDTYRTRQYVRWLGAGFHRVHHQRQQLALDDYLKLAAIPATASTRQKHATSPLYVPATKLVEHHHRFRVGVSLTAGNALKTMPHSHWLRLLQLLEQQQATVYVFGLENERRWLEQLDIPACFPDLTLVDGLGRLKLEELPWHISQMHLYLSTDTGNSYMADACGIALINFLGPCHGAEQRPLGEQALVLSSEGQEPLSFVFQAPYKTNLTPEQLYPLSHQQWQRIEALIERQASVARSGDHRNAV